MALRTTHPDGAAPGHPYSEVRTVDGRIGWVSGVVPYGDDGAVVVDRDAAIRQCLANLRRRIEPAGATMDDVVRTTVYLTDLTWREALDAAYRETFSPPLPARTAIEVRALPRGSGIEIDAVLQVAG